MIETNTTWKDSGFDCDHCGGEILERTDRETGQADFVCYQCKECGCQWSLSGDVLRIGTDTYCKAAQVQRQRSNEPIIMPEIPVDINKWVGLLSRSLWILLALIAGIVMLRFGGALVIRFLFPLILLGVGGYFLVRYGKAQSWW